VLKNIFCDPYTVDSLNRGRRPAENGDEKGVHGYRLTFPVEEMLDFKVIPSSILIFGYMLPPYRFYLNPEVEKRRLVDDRLAV
jgi:hypothetical protein